MKQSKKLTRRQKILISRMELIPDDYRVLVEGKSAILIENKRNGQVIRKFISEVLKRKTPAPLADGTSNKQ